MKKSGQVEGRPQVDEAVAGLGVEAVASGGIGEAVGIRPGDVIESINGEPVRDPIDYRFHVAEETVEVVLRRGDDVVVVDVEKEPDDDMGVTLSEMPIIKCNNKCVFCFLHQMPRKDAQDTLLPGRRLQAVLSPWRLRHPHEPFGRGISAGSSSNA